jgi:MobI protein
MKNFAESNGYQDHRDVTPIIEWVSGAFADLEYQGQSVVDLYWKRLKEGRNGRYRHELGTIGLRIRRRSNGAFSLQWYHMAYLGNTKRSIEGTYIRKGRSHQYNLDQVLKNQPEWLKVIVREIEAVLSEIRRRQAILMKLRNPLATYIREVEGKRVYASMMLEKYRDGALGGRDE